MSLRKLLVATDFSAPSKLAVEQAAAIASEHHAALVVVHVFDPSRFRAGERRADALGDERNAMRLLLDGTCEELARRGVKATPLFAEGFADELIVDAARAEAVDLVVVGSHGRTGVRRLWIGSIAENVVRACDTPVLVARGPKIAAFRRILHATDFSPTADRGLAIALELATPDAVVDVVHSVMAPLTYLGEPTPYTVASVLPELEAAAAEQGKDLVARFSRPDIHLKFETQVAPARDAVMQRLEPGRYELVVVGSHGRRGIRRLVLGSVAETVLRAAPCSVLIGR